MTLLQRVGCCPLELTSELPDGFFLVCKQVKYPSQLKQTSTLSPFVVRSDLQHLFFIDLFLG